MAKLLVDECLHTSLLELAHAARHIADHVTHLGLGGSKDWEPAKLIVERDYTFVTNNRTDFLLPYRRIQEMAAEISSVVRVRGLRGRAEFIWGPGK